MSAYGAGAPAYDSAELQRDLLQGRLDVAIGIRDRALASGSRRDGEKWSRVVDELLDRLLEVRGR